MKNTIPKLAMALMIFSTAAFAGKFVKSNHGSLDLLNEPAGEKVICNMKFSESAELLTQEEVWSLIKANCGQGYVENEDLSFVSEAKHKEMSMGPITILGDMDSEQMIALFGQEIDGKDEASIDRDFNEMLVATVDRERIEFINGEN